MEPNAVQDARKNTKFLRELKIYIFITILFSVDIKSTGITAPGKRNKKTWRDQQY